MTEDRKILQNIIAAQDASDMGKSLIDSIIPYNAQEIGKRLKEAFAGCKTSQEFDMVNKVVEAIVGWPIQNIIEEEQEVW